MMMDARCEMRDVRCRVVSMRLERTRMRGEGRVSGTDGMCAGTRVMMCASRRIARARAFGERPVACPPRARSRRTPTRQNGIPHSDATVRKTLVFRTVASSGSRGRRACRPRAYLRGGFRVCASLSGGVPGLRLRGRHLRSVPSAQRTARIHRSAFRHVRALALTSRRRTRSRSASETRSSACRPARLTRKCHGGAARVSECVRDDPKSGRRVSRASA